LYFINNRYKTTHFTRSIPKHDIQSQDHSCSHLGRHIRKKKTLMHEREHIKTSQLYSKREREHIKTSQLYMSKNIQWSAVGCLVFLIVLIRDSTTLTPFARCSWNNLFYLFYVSRSCQETTVCLETKLFLSVSLQKVKYI
jgi:hypothetical protein